MPSGVLFTGQEKFLPTCWGRVSSSPSVLPVLFPELSRTCHTLCPNQLVGHMREPSWKQKFVLKFPFCLSLLISPPCASLQTSDKTILYSVATTLVNCTNSYDVKEVIPELVQLAKFSKQHVPEEHPKVGMGTAWEGFVPPVQRGGKIVDVQMLRVCLGEFGVRDKLKMKWQISPTRWRSCIS